MARQKKVAWSPIINALEELYGFKIVTTLPESVGYRNKTYPFQTADGEWLNLIIYKDEPGIEHRIKNANRVSGYLASKGLPARNPFDGRIIKATFRDKILLGCLYNYLPGQVIPWEAYTARHLKLLGKTMADVHSALSEVDDSFLPPVEDEYRRMLGRMKRYFEKDGVRTALDYKLGVRIRPQALDYCESITSLCGRLPERQALHMDLVRGNILFDGEKDDLIVSGILDFEKAASGNRLFDLARTLAFLLTDSMYKEEDEIFRSFLLRGYVRAGHGIYKDIHIRTRDRELNLLFGLVDMFWLHDFYKFLRHNPYESLPINHHYMRTRDKLSRRGLIITSSGGRENVKVISRNEQRRGVDGDVLEEAAY